MAGQNWRRDKMPDTQCLFLHFCDGAEMAPTHEDSLAKFGYKMHMKQFF
jgi:hypothetical protein